MLLLLTFTYPPYCVAQDYLVQENRDGYQVEEKELKSSAVLTSTTIFFKFKQSKFVKR